MPEAKVQNTRECIPTRSLIREFSLLLTVSSYEFSPKVPTPGQCPCWCHRLCAFESLPWAQYKYRPAEPGLKCARYFLPFK